VILKELSKHSEKVAFISSANDVITYETISENISKFAKKEFNRGLVFCFCDNEPDFIIGYLSIIKNKMVPVMLNSQISESLLEKIDHSYKPNYYFISSSKFQELNLNNENVCYVFGNYYLVARKTSSLKIADNVVQLLSTSGSTGTSKFVIQTADNINSNLISIIFGLGLSSKDRSITTMPINYTYGLSVILSHLEVGGSIVLSNYNLTQRDFLTSLRDHKVTNFNGVPHHYEIIARFGEDFFADTSLEFITQAGGKLGDSHTKKIFNMCQKNKIKLYVMYGQTEATARISILDTSESPNKLKSVGKPILNGKIFIYDDFKKITENALLEGEIVYEGKNVSPGYAKNYLDLLVEKKGTNRLFTGDVGYIDSEGFLYITGRKKRFAKILGLSINLDELEEILKNLSYDAICISDDEKIYVAINYLHDIEVVSSLLSKFLKLSNARIQVFNFEEIPYTKSGKKDYQFFYQFLLNNGTVSNYEN